LRREDKWAHSRIAEERRAERYSQKPGLLIVTGTPAGDRKALARALEERLFDEGRFVYFLGIANVLYGVDADIERTDQNRQEHMRRVGEVANILLDAGLIVIATAVELGQDDLNLLRTSVGSDRVWTAWLGDEVTTDLKSDVMIATSASPTDAVARLKQLLRDERLIYSLA
jgi:bifunctional enzyme CysN/CysC